jgi:hypothetical protein
MAALGAVGVEDAVGGGLTGACQAALAFAAAIERVWM